MNKDYERHRRRMIAYGQWEPRIPAEPVREHLRALGASRRAIAEAAGVSASTVGYLLYSDPPSEWIKTATGRALMAVTPAMVSGDRYIDPTGTHRRLQALMAVGWSKTLLAEHLGSAITRPGQLLHAGRVLARNARAVEAVYDRLWDRPPPSSTREEKAAATRARRMAAAKGWAPPLAWDDDSINDPNAAPSGVGYVPPAMGKLPEPAEVRLLVQGGDSLEVLAERYGVNVKAVQKKLRLAKEETTA